MCTFLVNVFLVGIPPRFQVEFSCIRKMADVSDESRKEEHQGEAPKREIPPWAQGEQLRNVERDVLIPKIMREKAKVKCKDLVDGKIA